MNENNHADEGDTSKDRNGILDSETAQTIIEDPDLIDFISDFEEDSLRKNEVPQVCPLTFSLSNLFFKYM